MKKNMSVVSPDLAIDYRVDPADLPPHGIFCLFLFTGNASQNRRVVA
jgi:hypothetical protein